MKTQSCTRCEGTGGYELTNGAVVDCVACVGTGTRVILSRAEKAVRDKAWKMRCRALEAVKVRSRGMGDDRFQDAVRRGFDRLETEEPTRLVKLQCSLDAGRLDDVVQALAVHGSK